MQAAGKSGESPLEGPGDHEGGTRRFSEHSKANSVDVDSLRTEVNKIKDLNQDGWSPQSNEPVRRKRRARHKRRTTKTTQRRRQKEAKMRELKEYKWLHRQCRQQSSRESLNPQIGAKWCMRNPGKTQRAHGLDAAVHVAVDRTIEMAISAVHGEICGEINATKEQTTVTAAVEAVDSATNTTIGLTAKGTINAEIPPVTYMTVDRTVDTGLGGTLSAVIDAAIAVATSIGEVFRMVVNTAIKGVISITTEAKGKGSIREINNRADNTAVCGATKVASNGATTAAIDAVLRESFSVEVDARTATAVKGASMAAVGKTMDDTDTDKQISGTATNKRICQAGAGQSERSRDGQGERQGGSVQSRSSNATREETQHKLGLEVDMNYEDKVELAKAVSMGVPQKYIITTSWSDESVRQMKPAEESKPRHNSTCKLHHQEEYRPDQEKHQKTVDQWKKIG